eukprot:s2577_g9.t1
MSAETFIHTLLCFRFSNPPDFQEIFVIEKPSAIRAFSSERRRQCLAWPVSSQAFLKHGSSWRHMFLLESRCRGFPGPRPKGPGRKLGEDF